MNSHGLLAQEDGAEVEIQTRNATETEDDPEHLTGGEENQPDEEPATEDSSESESELQRTLDELKRQVRHERKAAIKAEKDRLMTELAELKNRNAPSSKKNGSPRRRIGAPTAVKVVRGGGKARVSGGRPNSNKSKKSPRRHVKTQHVTIDNLRSLHELSELADSELADLGLNQPAEQEPESDEDPGTDCFQNVNMNRTRYERQACPDVSNLPVGTRRHYDVVLPSHKGRDVVQLKYNFKVTSLLWRLSDCYDTTSVCRCVMVGYGRDLFPTISNLILTSPTQRLNDLF